ncbi:hypothetical protein SGLAM104S_00021 [Streptomyces glaucescens]
MNLSLCASLIVSRASAAMIRLFHSWAMLISTDASSRVPMATP